MQIRALEKIITECFWGDYRITPYDALQKLQDDEPGFRRFLAGRIIANSWAPTAFLKVLFSESELREILTGLSLSGVLEQRLALARAVLFSEPWEEEPSWYRI